MIPALTDVLLIVGLIVWLLVGVALGLAIGMGIREGDRREDKPCCPHDESEAPETVRGEFRAIIAPADPRGQRLDVRS